MTKQDIARVFAMYIGCEVQYMELQGGVLLGVIKGTQEGYFDRVAIKASYFENDYGDGILSNCRLRLKSLEDISDEHLKQIAKEFDAEWCKLDDNFLQIINEDKSLKHYFILDHWTLPYVLVDMFREWGYALPYKSQDLFTPLADGTIIAVREKV